MLALALLVVGGLALVNALTSNGAGGPDAERTEETGGNSGASATPTPQQTAAQTATSDTPLLIRVVGAPTQVIVRVSGGGAVLQQGTLNTGEARQFEQAPLDVVASNGGSVEVTIYGEKQEPTPAGQRGEWFVPER
jgi:hypothetical protein